MGERDSREIGRHRGGESRAQNMKAEDKGAETGTAQTGPHANTREGSIAEKSAGAVEWSGVKDEARKAGRQIRTSGNMGGAGKRTAGGERTRHRSEGIQGTRVGARGMDKDIKLSNRTGGRKNGRSSVMNSTIAGYGSGKTAGESRRAGATCLGTGARIEGIGNMRRENGGMIDTRRTSHWSSMGGTTREGTSRTEGWIERTGREMIGRTNRGAAGAMTRDSL